MPNIGPLEIAIVLIIVLVIFGPKRLPGLGKSLGTGMREFKESVTGGGKNDDHDDEDEDAPRLSKPSAADHAADAEEPPAADRQPAKTARSDAS